MGALLPCRGPCPALLPGGPGRPLRPPCCDLPGLPPCARPLPA